MEKPPTNNNECFHTMVIEPAFLTPTTLKKKKKKSTKSNRLRSKDNYYNIISQNLHGLKQNEKIEAIVNRMENDNIDIFLDKRSN